MRYYEILYIVNPNFERKKIDDTMKEIETRLKKTKSKIINHIIWGKKRLAYPIHDHKYGTYILVHYNGGNKNELHEFDSWLKLSDLVIRHMIVRLDDEPERIEKIDGDLSGSEKKEGVKEEKEGDSNIDEENKNEETKGVE